MKRLSSQALVFLLLGTGLSGQAFAQARAPQPPLSWEQVRQRFEQNNPTLLASKLTIDESKAQEITAYLRPNPALSLTADQINPFSGGPPHSTFGTVLSVATVSYLHERRHKRELRLESAREATGIATSGQADLEMFCGSRRTTFPITTMCSK